MQSATQPTTVPVQGERCKRREQHCWLSQVLVRQALEPAQRTCGTWISRARSIIPKTNEAAWCHAAGGAPCWRAAAQRGAEAAAPPSSDQMPGTSSPGSNIPYRCARAGAREWRGWVERSAFFRCCPCASSHPTHSQTTAHLVQPSRLELAAVAVATLCRLQLSS